MFGTILPDRSALTNEQHVRYRSLYCGLCRTLQCEYGIVARLTLSYDMTFLIVLLSSLYEPDEVTGTRHCLLHPLKPMPYASNRFTAYAAAVNVTLAYHKALDNWRDDYDLFSLLLSKLLRRSLKKAETRYPVVCRSIRENLEKLFKLEKQNNLDPDAAAASFGKLTSSVFSPNASDHWTDTLQKFGDSLGRFIYLSDALMDLEQDIRKGRYNPLREIVVPGKTETFLPSLQLYIGDCAKHLDHLPLVKDLDILRSVIYSGVWIPYERHRRKKSKRSDTYV